MNDPYTCSRLLHLQSAQWFANIHYKFGQMQQGEPQMNMSTCKLLCTQELLIK